MIEKAISIDHVTGKDFRNPSYDAIEKMIGGTGSGITRIEAALRQIDEEFGTQLHWTWSDVELKIHKQAWNEDNAGQQSLRRLRGLGRGSLADRLELEFAPEYEKRSMEAVDAANR